MADSQIKISLELADAAAQKALSDFISKGDKADQSLKRLKDSGVSTFDEISLHIGKSLGIYDIFAGNIAANLAIKGFEALENAAHSLYETFIVDGVKAASEQENAVNALNQSFAQAGLYSKEVSNDFQEFAKSLSETTTQSQTAIVKNAALIESLASLDNNGLKRATSAAINLSAATGKTFEEASSVLARAANGNITALTKMGIVIEKGRDNAETFSNALEAVESRFDGAAASKINTYSGAVAQASNSFEELQISIGDAIVKNPVLIDILHTATKVINEMTGAVHDNDTSLKLFVAQGASIFLQTMAGIAVAIDVAIKGFREAYGVVQALFEPFAALITLGRAFTVGFDQASNEFTAFQENMKLNLHALEDNSESALGKVAGGLLLMNESAVKGFDSLKQGATTSVEPLNNTTGKIKELTEEQKRANAVLLEFANNLLKQSSNAKDAAKQVLETQKGTLDVELALLDSQLQKKEINEVQYLEQKRNLEAQFAAKQNAIDDQQFLDEQAKLKASLNAKLINDTEYSKAREQLTLNEANRKKKISDDFAKTEIETEKKKNAAELKLQEEKVGYVADTFGNLSALMHTSSKELFEIGKASAVAQATINTYQAITKTMASVPYPFNIPLAIAQGVAGFVQVANIEKTTGNFADGGIVPGSSFSGDRLTANVNSGEMILNQVQQANLFKMANAQSQAAANNNLESKIDATNQLLAQIMLKNENERL